MAVQAPPLSSPPDLPVDILLLMFDHLGDRNLLWSTCRSVSRYWRACVDEYICHGIIQRTCVDLHYCDFHTRRGPVNSYVHVPMVFDRFSDDGVRAVFQQRAYRDMSGSRTTGSVRAWVPFIERYCKETQKPKPKVLNKSASSDAAPLWEQEHPHWRNTLAGDGKKSYLSLMRDMVSIGRGDRPPYYLKVVDDINDTELVSLEIDCTQHRISFDWRATYSTFFREQNFVACAYNSAGRKRFHDEDLAAVALRYFFNQNKYNHTIDTVRARQKRLAPWVAMNKHRMSAEVRLWTEHRVESEKIRVQQMLVPDNLCDVRAGNDAEEIVPAQLADDHPDLLFWPWGDEDRFFVPKKRSLRPHKCTVM